jgi:hypothetical protein
MYEYLLWKGLKPRIPLGDFLVDSRYKLLLSIG